MSKHVTYRGTPVDMDSLRRDNEKTVAVGNAGANARGDKIDSTGRITRTADQIARDNHRVRSAVVNTGVKGPVPDATGITMDQTSRRQSVQPKPTKRTSETELPSGDIIVDQDADL